MGSSSSSSSSEDDEATRAFAQVALQAELGLALAPARKSQGPKLARNSKIAEALDRMIGGTLAFETAGGNGREAPGQRASASEDVGDNAREIGDRGAEDHGGVRLFRKGPNVSKVYEGSKRREEASQRQNVVAPNRLPERRLVDLDAVFGSKDELSLRGIIVSGRPLVEALDSLKQETSRRRDESRMDRATEIGFVCLPPKRTARLNRMTDV